MKVCIYFEPKEKKNNFEGARLRKNIKGALELENIPYAKNFLDTFELAHFLSIKDETNINDLKANNVPVVFSALNCENDETARIMENKGGVSLVSPKAIRVLNKVDYIFVSDNTSKTILQRAGITTPIHIVSPGVNISRFEIVDKTQDEIFFQYYQLEKTSKFVVSIGSYEDKETIKKMIEIALLCPKYKFFYFGRGASEHHVYRKSKKMPANLRLATIMNDEVYCSMMKNAGIFLNLENSRHSPITLLDAAASKTQIIALKPFGYNEEILKDMRACMCENIDEVSKFINGIFEGKIPSSVKESYAYAKKNSLANLGKTLRNEYEQIIREAKKK